MRKIQITEDLPQHLVTFKKRVAQRKCTLAIAY